MVQVVEDSNDKIRSEVPTSGLLAHAGPAMRVKVMHGDWALNPNAVNESDPNQVEDIIRGGWRAEAIEWKEREDETKVISYRWSTMLHSDYSVDPHVRDTEAPEN